VLGEKSIQNTMPGSVRCFGSVITPQGGSTFNTLTLLMTVIAERGQANSNRNSGKWHDDV
jgi:hypothetical protein